MLEKQIEIKKNKIIYHLRPKPNAYGMVIPGKTPFICAMIFEIENLLRYFKERNQINFDYELCRVTKTQTVIK